jgi:2-alkyl-3-oxoalkanoate reductase
MRVFLTGGTGLIGSHVAERLRRRGDGVVALVRASSDSRHLAGLECELVEGDVLDDPAVQAARMRGCDALVHAAAKVFQGGRREEFLRQNVEGTERVLAGAGLAVPRVVHVSSVAVYAGIDLGRPILEDAWVAADPERQAAYAASKHLSERAAWRLHGGGAIRLTTVRPSVVYGERDRAATPILVRFAGRAWVPLPAGGRSNLPLVYAGNVARGILAALDRPASVGRAYNLALDQPITAREILELVGAILGRRPRVVPVPAGPLRALARTVDAVQRVLPFQSRGDLGRAVRSMTTDNPYESSRARLELGWANLIPHREGVRRTMEWWRERERS